MNPGADGFIRADQLDTAHDVIVDVSLVPHTKKILGALVRSPRRVLFENDLPGIPPQAVIAVYGDSGTVSAAVVEHLKRNGYVHAARLKGGFEAWQDSGMPLEDRPRAKANPSQ